MGGGERNLVKYYIWLKEGSGGGIMPPCLVHKGVGRNFNGGERLIHFFFLCTD